MIAAVVAVGALLALAACTGVPTSGPVEQVSAEPGRLNTGVEIAPAPPDRGATPITVVEGFLHAMASYQPDYEVARAYLTDAASASWSPEAGVRIYAEGNPVVATDTGATLRAPIVGTLDADGAYRQSTETIDHDFGLVKDDDGQWRISNPPSGLLVSEYLFTSAFTRVTPYFYEPGGHWLVPDPRYMPRGTAAIDGTARAVLRGATAWLASSVQAPPEGIDVDSVSVSSAGVATIVLRRGLEDLTEAQRAALVTQFVWSYRSFDAVVAVSVGWVGEDLWDVAPYGMSVPVTGFPEADPSARQGSRQLFAVSGGTIVRVTEGSQGAELLRVAPGITDASWVAVRDDALAAVAVNAHRTALDFAPLGESVIRSLGTSTGLRRPQFDRQGTIWVSRDDGSLATVTEQGTWTDLVVGGLSDGHIAAFRVSPDGLRLALVVELTSGKHVLGLARIERVGGDVSVQGWRELSVSTSSVAQMSVLDVGWRTADSLLVLVSDGRTTSALMVAQDGSTVSAIGPSATSDLVELAVAPGVPPMVRAADGEVWRYNSDFRWSAHASGLSSIVYP